MDKQQLSTYSWLNRVTDAQPYLKLYEEYSNLSMSQVGQYPVIATSDVHKEWERHLSDILFRVTGFSQFFGALAFQCQYKWTMAIPTAGALVLDGKFYVLINPLFLLEYLQKGEYQAFVIVHEVFHIFYEHGERGRESGFDPELFNIACDYYIHQSLEKMINAARTAIANVSLIPKDVFPICHDNKYANMTEEEIYAKLEEKQKQQQQQNGQGQGSGQGQNGNGNGNPDGDGEALDNPVQVESSGSGTSTANKQAVASAVRAAATQAQRSSSVGDAELGIIRRFLEVTEAKTDWRDEFADFFERTRDDRPTYSQYNRRSSDEVVLPSKEGERIKVGFGIDSSGSMGQSDLTEAASELQGLLEQIGTWEVNVATADSKAYVVAELRSDEEDDLSKIDLPGGGGTRMSAMVELFQDEWEDEYNVMVVFTDGHLQEGDILDVYDFETPLVVVVTSRGSVPEWLASEVTVIQIDK